MTLNPLLDRSVFVGKNRKDSTTGFLFFRRQIFGQHSKNYRNLRFIFGMIINYFLAHK